MRVTILLLLFCGTFFSACSKKTPDYLPLTDSSHWEHTLEFSSPGLGFQRGRGVMRVDGHETINGKDYSKLVVVVTGIPGYEPFYIYRRRTADAEYELPERHKANPAAESVALPLPPTVGKEWEGDTPDVHTKFKIEAIETAELADRKYEGCLKISVRRTYKNTTPPEESVGYQYLAPGVGIVKEYFRQGERMFTFTIDKHTK